MTVCEAGFDPLSAGWKPVHRGIEFSGIGLAEAEHVPETAGSALGRQSLGGSQLSSGAGMRAVIMAAAGSRLRDLRDAMSSSMRRSLSFPSAAATCPCGCEAVTLKASGRPRVEFPFTQARISSISPSGSSERSGGSACGIFQHS